MTGRTFETIKTAEPVPGVLKIALSRPERLNAMDTAMLDDLLSVSDEILAGYPDRYRAAVLCGEGRAFCSGGDVACFDVLRTEPAHVVESAIARFHGFARIWHELPLATVAAIHGACAGGGAGLALLCDVRLAAPDARIGFSFVKVGLVPDMGSHYTLPALVGPDRAFELLATGDFVDAEEAARLGLVTRVVPREKLEEEAVALAARFAAAPPEVVRTVKDLLRGARRPSLVDVTTREVSVQARRFKSAEFDAGLRRFLGKA